MDIKSHLADKFVRTPTPGLRAALVYGPDAGLVGERAALLAKQLAGSDPRDPGEIIRLNEDDLADDPDRLGIELRTMPMFGGRKIIRWQVDNRLRPDTVTALIDGPLAAFLIVEAGALKSDSKVRELFVKAADLAAIACQEDNSRALAGMIDEIMKSHRVSIASDARQHLTDLLGADRALSRGEVEKLALYAGDGGEVRITDIEAIVGDASDLQVDDIVAAVFERRLKRALADFDRAIAAGEQAQSILLAVQRQVVRLHQARAAMEGGANLDAAMKSLRPPTFFKAADQFAAQLRGWTFPDLSRALSLVQGAVEQSRRQSTLERELVERALIDVAALGA